MKSLLENINKAFDHHIRLTIVSVLTVNESVDFDTLKELLGITDGNPTDHTRILEAEEYIVIEKSLVGRKANASYKATKKRRETLREHLNALGKLADLSINR